MMRIAPLAADDIGRVVALARHVWQATYAALISQAQIDYMLGQRYAPEALASQLDDPAHVWRVAWVDGQCTGFAHGIVAAGHARLDKLYVAPAWQRRGIGAALLAAVEGVARAEGAQRIRLQVNRGNAQAIAAYRKYGFSVVEARVFDIGAGFVMDDYVMEKTL
jgi:ribosomal protein S18 acetylase RimI-like enzyme